jgi:cbb3-type cytochrome oxidase maturation protein
MSVIILLILVSVLVALGFLIAFIWAVKSGQYDDTYSPSVRMLFGDKKPKIDEDDKKMKVKPPSSGP